jgi:uncharacterized protein YqjF (DUF2071 family)
MIAAPQIRTRLSPLLVADWRDALFIHFRVDPAKIQALVPLPLDLIDGQARVSLVAFTQQRLRPAIRSKAAEFLSRPLARHEFLNLRTYVRHNGEPGIFFVSEWIPNSLAVFLGPRLYGLPYKLAQLAYHTTRGYAMRHVVADGGESSLHFSCVARWEANTLGAVSERGSETEFLLERYTAYTHHRGLLRRFRIAHEPWLQIPVSSTMVRRDLISQIPLGEPHCAHYSPGLRDVQITAPTRL